MPYSKKDAQMTRGLAIISMLLLHLFCRLGEDVFGTPLLWINENKPLVYCFGFFSEICVPLYSICVGYGQQFLYEHGNTSWKKRLSRIGTLLMNYWVIVVLFAIASKLLMLGEESLATPVIFFKNIFLLETYNGAWWYLHSYVFALLLPTCVLLWIPNKLKEKSCIVFCIVFQVVIYSIERFHMMDIPTNLDMFRYIFMELKNFIGILSGIWIGACFCKYDIIEKLRGQYIKKIKSKNTRIAILGISITILFIAVNLIHKVVLFLPVTMIVFIMFNLWEKNKYIENIFLFLGKHSTNIWLTHMFFYAYVFENLIVIARYPLLIFGFMIFLCCITSQFIIWILKLLKRIVSKQ